MFTQVDQNEVFLVTETLTRFVLVGEAATPLISKPVKHLKLAVFGASPSQSTTLLEYSVRVYVVEDTKSSLEVCMTRTISYLRPEISPNSCTYKMILEKAQLVYKKMIIWSLTV